MLTPVLDRLIPPGALLTVLASSGVAAIVSADAGSAAHAADASTPLPTVVRRETVSTQAMRDHWGNRYEPATGFTGGRLETGGLEGTDIWNTVDDKMYVPARVGVQGWATNLPNGAYDVTLKFRESAPVGHGARVFDVTAEGSTRLESIDVEQTVGYRTALDKIFRVDVRDGRLDLRFVPRRGVPLVSAIVVAQVSLLSSVPNRPVDTEGPALPAPAAAVGYSRLAFRDEFDNLATIDLTGRGDSTKQWFTDRPFGWGRTPGSDLSIRDGVLRINQTTASPNFAIATSSAASKAGRGFHYGYFEARLAFDPSKSVSSPGFPAFWGVSHAQVIGANKPRSSEIDFFEAYSAPYTRFDDEYAGTVHDFIIEPKQIDRANWGNNVVRLAGFDWNAFHTYGTLWEPGKITWFLDGEKMLTQQYSAAAPPSPNPQGYEAGLFSELDTDTSGQSVILGSGVGYPMKVDWVRVWQR